MNKVLLGTTIPLGIDGESIAIRAREDGGLSLTVRNCGMDMSRQVCVAQLDFDQFQMLYRALEVIIVTGRDDIERAAV